MGLFHFGKKKKEKKEMTCGCNSQPQETVAENCGCGGACSEPKEQVCECGKVDTNSLSIKVLGSGCKTCHDLYDNVQEAITHTGLSANVEYVTDLEKVMQYGVMSMPGLVVNEKVVSMGKLLKPTEIENLLKKLGF